MPATEESGQERRCWSLGRRVRTSLDSRLGRAANNRDRAVLCRAGLGSEIAAIFRWRRPMDEASAPPEPPAPAVSGDASTKASCADTSHIAAGVGRTPCLCPQVLKGKLYWAFLETS